MRLTRCYGPRNPSPARQPLLLLRCFLATRPAGASDRLAALAWSPEGCRRVLMTATAAGSLLAWSQTPREPSATPAPVALQDWHASPLAELVGERTSQGSPPPATLVHAGWLEPPPAWPWRPGSAAHVAAGAAAVYNLFVKGAAAYSGVSDTGDLHWVQPGTPALAAVLSDGTVTLIRGAWGAYGVLEWGVLPCSSRLAPPAESVVAAAAAACAGGVSVAWVLASQPGALCVACVEGDPHHSQCASLPGSAPVDGLRLRRLGGATVLPTPPLAGTTAALCWDSASYGTRLAVALTPAARGAPCLAYVFAVVDGVLVCQGSHLACQGQQGQEPSPPTHQSAQQPCDNPCRHPLVAWLLDGKLAVGSSQQALTLLHVPSTQEQQQQQQQPDGLQLCDTPVELCQPAGSRGSTGVLAAMIASPHGVALAALLRTPAGSGHCAYTLLLANVPATTTAAAAAAAEMPGAAPAALLLWSLLQQRHPWDIAQHVICWAGDGAPLAPGVSSMSESCAMATRMGDALACVDRALAVQAPVPAAALCARWDVLKLLLLEGTPGRIARAVGMDLRMRLLSNALKPTVEAAKEVCVPEQSHVQETMCCQV